MFVSGIRLTWSTITLEQTSFSMPPAVMSHWADAELMPLDGKEERLRPFMLTQIMREVNAPHLPGVATKRAFSPVARFAQRSCIVL